LQFSIHYDGEKTAVKRL